MQDISFIAAFFAGVVSFLSPCVLPLVPGYLSFISGASLEELRGDRSRTVAIRAVARTSLSFVAGFSLVFIVLGLSVSALSGLLPSRLLLTRVAGVLILVFGVHVLGLVRIPFLYRERRFHPTRPPAGFLGAFVLGLAFAFGWTPCLGPILAAILALAGTQETLYRGALLLVAYSVGLGLPFILTGIGIGTFWSAFERVKRHLRAVEIVSGLLLIGIGLLMLFGRFSLIAGRLMEWFPSASG